jgi:ribosomal protein L11 methyltransferase
VIVPAAQSASAKLPKQSLPIVLIQGQAFGSGQHESTRLMLQIIASRPPLGQDVLDVGAGSGILGFACLHLGARRAVSVEVESAACDELRRNRTLNGVAPGRLPVLCGRYPLKRLQGRRFPWVLGNLVTPVLVALMPRLGAQVAPQGTLLCSGIHTDPEAEAVVAAARKAGLALKERAQLRQWNVLRFLRP